LFSRNVFINLLGAGYGTALQFLVLPISVKYLGPEALGLVGVFGVVVAVCAVFDSPLSTFVTRQISIYSGSGDKKQAMPDLVRTIEVAYLGFIGVVFLASLLFVPYLAEKWINAHNISTTSIQYVFFMLTVQMVAQFFSGLYLGALNGLQQFSKSNAITAVTGSLRAIGSIAILVLMSQPLIYFFLWQAIVTIATAVVLAYFLWSALPSKRGSFRKDELNACKSYGWGIFQVGCSAALYSQMDKVLLSRLLPLADFGYYSIATSMISLINRASMPIFQVLLPSLTQSLSRADVKNQVLHYHQSTVWLSRIVWFICILIAITHQHLLPLYFGDAKTSSVVGPLLAVLAVGAALNGIAHAPFALCIAHARTRLLVGQNIVGSLLLILVIFFANRHYGVQGAAWGSALVTGLCCVYVGLRANESLPKGTNRLWFSKSMWGISVRAPV
jgi:O-antigen/teichoic acid export membrane protein